MHRPGTLCYTAANSLCGSRYLRAGEKRKRRSIGAGDDLARRLRMPAEGQAGTVFSGSSAPQKMSPDLSIKFFGDTHIFTFRKRNAPAKIITMENESSTARHVSGFIWETPHKPKRIPSTP